MTTRINDINQRISGLGTSVPIYLGNLSDAADDVNFLLSKVIELTEEVKELRIAVSSLEDETYSLESQLAVLRG